jgi:hypothetical protein
MNHIVPREEAPFVERFVDITEAQWQEFARYVAQPHVADRIIERAQLTPYFHLDGYMNRWWLFNPHQPNSDGEGREFPELASVRIHQILRADNDRDLHNHPWDARTIILKGWYDELREGENGRIVHAKRRAGDTAAISAKTFHTITAVAPETVWTMFFMGRKVQPWGYATERGFVHWSEYLAAEGKAS